MALVEVLVEHANLALCKPYTYSTSKPVQPGCRVFVPFGRQKLMGIVLKEGQPLEDDSITIRPIEKIVDETPILSQEQLDLAAWLGYETISSTMSLIHTMLPKKLDVLRDHPDFSYELWVVKNESSKNLEDLSTLLRQTYEAFPPALRLKEARELTSAYRLQALIQKGFLRKEKRVLNFGTLPKKLQQEWPTLNTMQQNALQSIRQAKQQTILLHGATGSGKTEIFFHLAKEALDQGKQVLILVPEISLTPMMEARIAARFNVDVYACHSRLSDSEMVSVWNNVKKAGPCIVIGTRKSVFLPLEHLGLIIMDEEHDGSYKQDNAPRYHARDAAQFRAAYHGCKLVLASATPSLESYARALKGVYGLAELPRRAAGEDAHIRLVDLRYVPVFCNYSAPLVQAIEDRLTKHQKTMILLNRRGYLPVVRCENCHEYVRCEDCNVALSYHKQEEAYVCHVCGRRYPVLPTCPHCHTGHLGQMGQGTERLEEESQSLFPKANIVRMDRDTTKGKYGHRTLLKEFEDHGDILMGTQMIAKGLDYHAITLCGILSIDTSLSRPDYLANERTYQLCEQAAGRAGRGQEKGLVLIQTFDPQHFVLQAVQSHRYKDFFVQEMRYRHAGQYPPYTFLASIIIRHDDPTRAYQKALELQGHFLQAQVDVLGPVEISMRQKQSRFRLVLRDKDDEHLKEILWQGALWFEKHAAQCKMDINVHPMTIEE